jgi:hypothetical protein
MKTQTIFRFAVLCALFGASTALTAPVAFAQKEDRNGRSGTAKEDRNRGEAQNKNKEGRGGSGTAKSGGRNDSGSKGRKDRR